MLPGLDMYYTDPAHHIRAAGGQVGDLRHGQSEAWRDLDEIFPNPPFSFVSAPEGMFSRKSALKIVPGGVYIFDARASVMGEFFFPRL